MVEVEGACVFEVEEGALTLDIDALRDETMELVRARLLGLIVGVVTLVEMVRDMVLLLGVDSTLPPSGILTLEWVLRRPLPSPLSNIGACSSMRALRRVLTEFVEIRRERFRESVISRSSEKFPEGVNWECSAGRARAEAIASRTGKGVRLRTWMELI